MQPGRNFILPARPARLDTAFLSKMELSAGSLWQVNRKLVSPQSSGFFPLILGFTQWCVTVKVADYSNAVLTCKYASLLHGAEKHSPQDVSLSFLRVLPINIPDDFWVTFTYPFLRWEILQKNRLRVQSGSIYCLAYNKNGQAQIRWPWQRHLDCQETVWQAWLDLSFWTACRELLPGKA